MDPRGTDDQDREGVDGRSVDLQGGDERVGEDVLADGDEDRAADGLGEDDEGGAHGEVGGGEDGLDALEGKGLAWSWRLREGG